MFFFYFLQKVALNLGKTSIFSYLCSQKEESVTLYSIFYDTSIK